VRNAPAIMAAVSRQLGIEDGQTTEDMLFSLETVACLGACALSPVMVMDGKYYGKMTARRAEGILGQIAREEQG
jgi:NADH:ubiquinone oxidoreductase subunit E